MNKLYLPLFVASLCCTISKAQNSNFAFGADLSSLKQVEEKCLVFKDNNQLKPAMQIFKDHGYNLVRLRTCVEPASLPQGLAYTIALAKDAKKMGFKLLLDLHYSNAWADPTNQHPLRGATLATKKLLTPCTNTPAKLLPPCAIRRCCPI